MFHVSFHKSQNEVGICLLRVQESLWHGVIDSIGYENQTIWTLIIEH